MKISQLTDYINNGQSSEAFTLLRALDDKTIVYNLLHDAIEEKHIDTALFLLAIINVYNLDINYVHDASNKSFLLFAIEKKCTDLVEPMLRDGADINAIDQNGNNALHIILSDYKDEDFPLVKVLIKHKANINHENDSGQLPIELILDDKPQDLKVRQLLVNHDALVPISFFSEAAQNDESLQVYEATQNGYVSTLRNILNGRLQQKTIENDQVLAPYNRRKVIMKLLNHRYEDDGTLLSIAVKRNQPYVVEFIMKSLNSITDDPENEVADYLAVTDRTNRTALQTAVGHATNIKLLYHLLSGYDNVDDALFESALTTDMQSTYRANILKALLLYLQDKDDSGIYALMLKPDDKAAKIFQSRNDTSDFLTAKSEDGAPSPLFCAVAMGKTELTALILKRIESPEKVAAATLNGHNILHTAYYFNQLETAKAILESPQCSTTLLEAKTNRGETYLMLALFALNGDYMPNGEVYNGSEYAIEEVLTSPHCSKNILLDHMGQEGSPTVLFKLVSLLDIKFLRIILNADYFSEDMLYGNDGGKSYGTILHAIALSIGRNANAVDPQFQDKVNLVLSSQYGSRDLFEATDKDGHTCLHLTVNIHDPTVILEHRLCTKAFVHKRSVHGSTVLDESIQDAGYNNERVHGLLNSDYYSKDEFLETDHQNKTILIRAVDGYNSIPLEALLRSKYCSFALLAKGPGNISSIHYAIIHRIKRLGLLLESEHCSEDLLLGGPLPRQMSALSLLMNSIATKFPTKDNAHYEKHHIESHLCALNRLIQSPHCTIRSLTEICGMTDLTPIQTMFAGEFKYFHHFYLPLVRLLQPFDQATLRAVFFDINEITGRNTFDYILKTNHPAAYSVIDLCVQKGILTMNARMQLLKYGYILSACRSNTIIEPTGRPIGAERLANDVPASAPHPDASSDINHPNPPTPHM